MRAMCIAIYPRHNDDRLAVKFVVERIYQRRDGGRVVTIDALIQNASDRPLSRFRFAFPARLVDPTGAMVRDKNEAQRRVKALRAKQLDCVELRTSELALPVNPENWIYRTLPHVDIDAHSSKDGSLVIRRTKQQNGDGVLSGYIKQDWVIEQPEDVDDWAWTIFACNDLAVFTVHAPDRDIDRIHSSEAAWFRFQITVPPAGLNRMSLVWRIFGRSREYIQEFRSPGAVVNMIRERIEKGNPASLATNQKVREGLAMAHQRALGVVPPPTVGDGVGDWRCFFFREYGLSIESVSFGEHKPKVPEGLTTYRLPRHAHPRGCATGPAPRPVRAVATLLEWLRANMPGAARPHQYLEDRGLEFWFGTDHALDAAATYTIEIRSRYSNRIYAYVTWISLALGIVNFFWRLTAGR